MTIYLINIIIITLFSLGSWNIKAGDIIINKKARVCIIFSICWILLSGLRGMSIGPDTRAYGQDFIDIVETPWSVLLDNIVQKTSSFSSFLESNPMNKDPGFKIITKCISVIAPTYQLYLIGVALMFMPLLGRFLYKNTKNPFLGFLLFDCLFYSFYAITGIRQTLATALIVFIGYDYIKERKLIKFLLISGIAFFIHKSALCFVPFYFISEIKITRRIIISFTLFIVFSFVFRYQLMNFLSIFMGYEQYNRQYDTSGPITFTLLIFAVFIFCIIFKKSMLKKTKDFKYKFLALSMSLFFLPLAFIDPSAMRVSYYYALFLMILIPDIIELFSLNQKKFITLIITILMILLLISNNPVYKFFWQDY